MEIPNMRQINKRTKHTIHKINISLEKDSLHFNGRNRLISCDIFFSSSAYARLRFVVRSREGKKSGAGEKKKGARKRPVSVTGQTRTERNII